MDTFADAIGWTSSALLLATLARQIIKQYREGGEGVSHWLFIGQTLASAGFITYSVLLHNWVFIVTNSLILLTAIVGFGLQMHQRRKNGTQDADPHAEVSAAPVDSK